MSKANFSLLNSESMIDFVRPWLSKSNRHLDFGAGNGEFVLKMLDEGYNCAAYEIAEGRTETWKAEEFIGNPNFLGPATAERSEKYDVVFLLDVIEHVLDSELESTMERIKSFMKKGSLIIVSTPNSENLEEGVCICPRCHIMFHRWQHVRSFNDASLIGLFKNNGFEKVALHKVDFSENAHILDELKLLREKVLFYEYERSANLFRRLYYAFFPNTFLDRGKSSRGVQGEELRIGAESHLIYIGRING